MVYEVEFRCHFESLTEASTLLPFLHQGLQRGCTWNTVMYGTDYFLSGKLIRTAEVIDDEGPRYFAGWKGPDTGKFCNIRQEVNEEIVSPASSNILKQLGGSGEVNNIVDVAAELARLGYARFMSFEGEDLTGYNEQYGIHLKLMHCLVLKWPLIVEIEKTARSLDEAVRCENSLYALCRQFQLQDRVIRDEPPTLLYKALFE